MLSLSTTNGMGSSEMRPEQAQRAPYLLDKLANLIGFKECQKVLVQEWLIYLLFLWATFETGIVIPFLTYFPFFVHTCCRWTHVLIVALKRLGGSPTLRSSCSQSL